MASEASFWITVSWEHKSPCVCGASRWWVVVAGRGVGWAHADGTEACISEGA